MMNKLFGLLCGLLIAVQAQAASPADAKPEVKNETGATAGPNWQRVETLGRAQLVLIDAGHARDPKVYRAAILNLCTGKSKCKVMFWDDEAHIPSNKPITDEQKHNQTADWTFNQQRHYASMLWSCDIVNNDTCF